MCYQRTQFNIPELIYSRCTYPPMSKKGVIISSHECVIFLRSWNKVEIDGPALSVHLCHIKGFVGQHAFLTVFTLKIRSFQNSFVQQNEPSGLLVTKKWNCDNIQFQQLRAQNWSNHDILHKTYIEFSELRKKKLLMIIKFTYSSQW